MLPGTMPKDTLDVSLSSKPVVHSVDSLESSSGFGGRQEHKSIVTRLAWIRPVARRHTTRCSRCGVPSCRSFHSESSPRRGDVSTHRT